MQNKTNIAKHPHVCIQFQSIYHNHHNNQPTNIICKLNYVIFPPLCSKYAHTPRHHIYVIRYDDIHVHMHDVMRYDMTF